MSRPRKPSDPARWPVPCGRCWTCVLAATIDRLLTNPATGVMAPELAQVANALKSMKRANSGLTWIKQKHVHLRPVHRRRARPEESSVMTGPPSMTRHLSDLEGDFDPNRPRDYDPQELVRFALGAGGYWANLALGRLERGVPGDGLVPELDAATRDMSLPQAARHKAQRLLKMLRPRIWTAWVKDAAGQVAVEDALRSLVGRGITGSRYIEINYEGGAEGWQTPTCDELDYGLELDLHGDETWSIIWEQADLNEGLNVRPGRLIPESVLSEGAAARDVSRRWAELGPREITAVKTAWTRISAGPAYDWSGQQVADAKESDLCLTTLQLIGRDGRCAIITLLGADTVQVYFSEDAARDANVLMPRPRTDEPQREPAQEER